MEGTSTNKRIDTAVDDVRRVREVLSNQFGNDVDKLAEHVRQVGEEYRARLGLKAGPSVTDPAGSPR